ncbi:hypothetical protein GCM10018965_078870 [Nonomuraea roseola]
MLTVAGSHRRAALCQVDGFRWGTLEGPATVRTDPERIGHAACRYAERCSPVPASSRTRVRPTFPVAPVTTIMMSPSVLS